MLRGILQQQVRNRAASAGPTPLIEMAFDGDLINTGSVTPTTIAWSVGADFVTHGVGQAANFEADGANYVSLSGAGSELSGMNQVTLSFDFRVDTAVANVVPVWLHTVYGINMSGATSHVEMYLNTTSGTEYIGAAAPQAFDGNWHHLSANYDALTGTATVYLDGVAIASQSDISGPVPTTTRTLTVGTDAFGKNFDGEIDNLRIYDAIVTP